MANIAISNQSILLDTNVIEYLLSTHKNLANKVAEKLSELRKNKNRLYVSEITSFEILRGISDEAMAINKLNSFIKIPIL